MRMAVVTAVAGFALAALNLGAQEKPRTNGTNPAQVVEIQKQIEQLKVHKGASPYLNIQEVGGEAIIQLARCETNWSLNIAYYPSKETPVKALAAVGMTIPQTWQEEQFEAGTVAQYGLPQSDLAALPQFIHNLFVKFFRRPSSYRLEFSIESDEPLPKEMLTKPEVKFSLGDDKRMNATGSSKSGQVVSFDGLVSTMTQNGQLTEARIGNMDDNMKTSYGIVLDEKGKQLAESKGAAHVKGRIEVKNGKNMLVVEEFSKK